MHAGQLKASLPCAPSLPSAADGSEASPPSSNKEHALGERRRMALPGASVMSVARPTSVRHCAVTVKSMHGAFVLVVVGSQCVPWPTPVHTHRAAVGAARALLQVFRSLAAVCSPSIVAFDFGFSDRSFSATLCEKDNPERKPPS